MISHLSSCPHLFLNLEGLDIYVSIKVGIRNTGDKY